MNDFYEDDDKPQASTMIGDVEYMSVAEYVRRLVPDEYPVVDELISSSGVDRTYQRLGQMAASVGRTLGITPARLYHPDFITINGWPVKVIQPAWINFHARYEDSMRWEPRDEVQVPQPVPTPAPPYSSQLLDQLQQSLQIRGIDPSFTHDPRWRDVFAMLTSTPRNETPEQALVRRTSATATLYAIEREYQGR